MRDRLRLSSFKSLFPKHLNKTSRNRPACGRGVCLSKEWPVAAVSCSKAELPFVLMA